MHGRMVTLYRQFKFNVRTVHIRRSRNDQQYALIVPLLYSIYWLLHVSAVACHHQGASVRKHDNLAHESRNNTLYDTPPILSVFQVTRKDLRSSQCETRRLLIP
jgi:hypothetical protein